VSLPVATASPLELLDGAFALVRRGGGARLLRSCAAAAPLAFGAIALHYFERVEGVHALRPAFALGLVLAFVSRCLHASRIAREYALLERPSLPVCEPEAPAIDIALSSAVVGFGLVIWLWPFAALATLSPYAVAAALPFAALRGAVAPSWLARAACAKERGLAAFGQAFDDTSGMRAVFLIVELVTLFGTLGLFANLYAATSMLLLLGRSFLGLDVAFVEAFLSLDNGLMIVLLGALVFVAFEPLRAAISAQAFVDARSRRDGADLQAAIAAAIAHSQPRRRGPRGSLPPSAAALLVLGGLLGAAASTRAQPVPPPAATADAPEASQTRASDDEVRHEVSAIVGRPEFREFAEGDSHTLRQLIDKLMKWLQDQRDGDRDEPFGKSLRLPEISPWVLMAVLLVLLGLVAVQVARSRGAAARPAQAGKQSPVAAVREPAQMLDEAAELAARGDFHAALRALYLATLFRLDRLRLVDYEPSKTNWQYTRALPRGELRKAFAAFTRIFDRAWYGHLPATQQDYEQCRALVASIDAARSA